MGDSIAKRKILLTLRKGIVYFARRFEDKFFILKSDKDRKTTGYMNEKRTIVR